MTAEEWARIKNIFEAALNLLEEDRDEYLRSAASDEPQVYGTVVELLRNHQSLVEASKRLRTRDQPALLPGELIADRFRILRFIAAGGMGEVYEASDEKLKIRLALKTLRSTLLADPESFERFRREIVIARSVSHENLCRVFDFIEHKPSAEAGGTASALIPCLTMELLDGESLAELIRKKRPLSVSDALPLVLQIAEGLQVLHDHGVIHRDLKPSNVMLVRSKNAATRAGVRAVVMDFGLAKRQDAEGDMFESKTDLQAGAPYFMAPELLGNVKPGKGSCKATASRLMPSEKSDIYSLGMVIDEMLTSSRAFTADSLWALYVSKLEEDPIDPATRAEGLPQHWAETILRCLDRNVTNRFSSVRDVVRALESGSVPVGPHLSPVDRGAGVSIDRRPISRRAMIIGVVAVPVFAGTAGLVGMAFQRVETTVEVFNIENLTKTKDYDYFCKGITNELMRSLLLLDGVRVLPVYATRGDSPSKRLGRFSLDGLLEAQNSRMRLSMRLTDNQDGRLVWSESYNRQAVSNPIELESDIAHGAVVALEHHILSRGETTSSRGLLAQVAMPLRRVFAVQASAALPGPPTYSNSAFDYYMRGHSLLEEMSPTSIESATEYFRRAIQEDPNFALAYAAESDAQIMSMNYHMSSRVETLEAARSYAEEAVRRDGGLAEAHMVLGAVQQIEWDWSGAESSFMEALRLKPNLARARRWYGGLILQFQRFDQAMAEIKRALELDPYDRSGPPAFGMALTMARKFDEAEDVLLRSLESKDMVATRINLAVVYAWLGHINSGTKSALYLANAFAQLNTAVTLEKAESRGGSQSPLTDALMALFYTFKGNDAAAKPYLDKSDLAADSGTLSPVFVAQVYAARRDDSRAIDLLNRSASWHDRSLMYVNISPFFDNLHGQPGFNELLNRMKLDKPSFS